MGNPEWTRDTKFADMFSRHQKRQELDQRMAEWTIQYTHYEVMNMLQAAGVAAMPSFCATEILEDPHTAARSLLTSVEHPLLKTQHVFNPPWKLSETPATVRKPGPCLGEDNVEVFTQLLGMTEDEVKKLEEEKILY